MVPINCLFATAGGRLVDGTTGYPALRFLEAALTDGVFATGFGTIRLHYSTIFITILISVFPMELEETVVSLLEFWM